MGSVLVFCILLGISASPAAAQKPVDTHQFGLIQRGMTEPEVRTRLGPPARTTVGAVTDQYGQLVRNRHGEIVGGRRYHYPGSRSTLPTVIMFVDGRVVGKVKGRLHIHPP
jgi:hypothetical protein